MGLEVARYSVSQSAPAGLEGLPNHGVVVDVEYLAAVWLDQQTGPIEQPAPQSLMRLEEILQLRTGRASVKSDPQPRHGKRPAQAWQQSLQHTDRPAS